MITDKEKQVLDSLSNAWNLFIEMERQHPNEAADFADGIHKCQQIIALRVARSIHPDVFPIKK